MKNPVFRLKQFNIDQTGSGMKVNTDGVLLGAIADYADPKHILEIGTGTGIIALMLAQRFPEAVIDAVEIDPKAAQCAENNFRNSPFAARLTCIPESFQHYFTGNTKRYNLVVCNPPYFIDSLKSGIISRNTSRHTEADFFSELIEGLASHLSLNGNCYLILPLGVAELVSNLCKNTSVLNVVKQIAIKSFPDSEPFRTILVLSPENQKLEEEELHIYDSQNIYSARYKFLLQDFLTIF